MTAPMPAPAQRHPRRLVGGLILRLMNFWPPFLGAGIRVRRTASGGFESRLRLGLTNRNFFGTHFGGSLYAMCDPFFVLLLAEALGSDYLIWDKAATIRFRRPAKGTVRARFEIAPERVEELRAAVERDGKTEPVFQVTIFDQAGQIVAEVEKVLWVKKK